MFAPPPAVRGGRHDGNVCARGVSVSSLSLPGVLPELGALLTCTIGVVGLVAPRKVLAATRLENLEGYSTAEGRSTFGLMLLALGGIPLVTGETMAFVTAGAAWLGAAAGRLASLVLDGRSDNHNLLGMVCQAFIGALLMFPQSA